MDKEISDKLKLFLIKLIRNNDYFDSSYNKSETTLRYNTDKDERIRVDFNISNKYNFFTFIKIYATGFNKYQTYNMGYRIFFLFNKINWDLYQELKKIKKKVDEDTFNEQYNKMADFIPKKYIRLDKIKKLMK